ncbi:MAG: ISL3 family transposase, partial [Thermoleophilia bacterium]
MRNGRVFARLLGLDRVVFEDVMVDEDGSVVVAVRPRDRSRCGVCGRRSPGYDRGEGRRRWRALDLGTTVCFLEAEAPRVRCKRHGVVVAAVPWARHDSRFTRSFEDQVAWLACECSKRAVSELMRIAWLTVGRILARVAAEKRTRFDPLDHLRRIGIDELSYRVGQRYITVVVDHDTGRLVWACEGRDKKTVGRFFAELGKERKAGLELVSSDMGEWITRVVAKECPSATLCLDPFHVLKLATDALDEVRREVWNLARRSGDAAGAR